jgi:hypothetical protein
MLRLAGRGMVMISGIMPCARWNEIGYPWRQAISCWSKVCDEIILVLSGPSESSQFIGEATRLMAEYEKIGRKCNILVRSIQTPALTDFGSYGAYLMYGICLASNPDWGLAIEADYLISPENGVKLRKCLEEASDDFELVTARAVTMNYVGSRRLYLPDMLNWFPPYDGFVWERPIGCRIGLGIYPGMFCGIDRDNNHNTCEGFIRLRRGEGWGKTYHSKNRSLYGDNGFRILNTGLDFEHLTFTKNPDRVIAKLDYPDRYFQLQGIGVKEVVEGSHDYGVTYAELKDVQTQYAARELDLRSLVAKTSV